MIKSVQKATNLLTILADNCKEPVSLATLSEQAGIHKSTCSHIMSTLEKEGFAVKISSRKGYVLGPAAYCLTRFGRYKDDFIATCRPIMQYLHHHTGYAVVLAVLEGSCKYVIDYIDEGNIFSSNTEIMEDDIYRTATGRAILTNLSAQQIYDVYKKHGNPKKKEWESISSLSDLMEKIAKLKKQDVIRTRAVSPSGQMLYFGYGAAIFGTTGCMGAIGIAANLPCEKELEFQKEEPTIKQLLAKGAKEISRRLSYQSFTKKRVSI